MASSISKHVPPNTAHPAFDIHMVAYVRQNIRRQRTMAIVSIKGKSFNEEIKPSDTVNLKSDILTRHQFFGHMPYVAPNSLVSMVYRWFGMVDSWNRWITSEPEILVEFGPPRPILDIQQMESGLW